MHPAYSVIFFTVSSGAGFGLMAIISLGVLFGWWDPTYADSIGAGFALLLGAVLAVAGLLSSTRHLGHPERALLAFSQWRSSWLSREGVLAVATFIPVAGLLLAWWRPGAFAQWATPLALVTAVLAIATVYSTAMIYASLKTIPRWNQAFVAPVYLLFALVSGALLALLLTSQRSPSFVKASVLLLVLAWVCKWLYWHAIDNAKPVSTAESATGLGALGQLSSLELPHTSANYIQKEMGFKIARKHAQQLRRISLVLGFIVPLFALLVALTTSGALQTIMIALSVVSLLAALLVERWLFFAEAEHVVTLFYGASSV